MNAMTQIDFAADQSQFMDIKEKIEKEVAASKTALDQTFAVSLLDICRRAAAFHRLGDNFNERALGGKENQRQDDVWQEAAIKLWDEGDRLSAAASELPPRTLQDACGQLVLVMKIAHDLNWGEFACGSEKEIRAANEKIEKLAVGIFEILAPAAGLLKTEVADDFFVNRAAQMWGFQIGAVLS